MIQGPARGGRIHLDSRVVPIVCWIACYEGVIAFCVVASAEKLAEKYNCSFAGDEGRGSSAKYDNED